MDRFLCEDLRHIMKLIRRNLENSDVIKMYPDLTNMMSFTIGYVFRSNEAGKIVYQKDIEREFKINRSSATGLLQSLEQLGYIVREADLKDARMKRIVLTAKAKEVHYQIKATFDRIEHQALDGFSPEEIPVLLGFLERVQNNLELEKGRLK